MRNNFFRCFHVIIIPILVVSFIGCGYKSPPVYTPVKKSA